SLFRGRRKNPSVFAGIISAKHIQKMPPTMTVSSQSDRCSARKAMWRKGTTRPQRSAITTMRFFLLTAWASESLDVIFLPPIVTDETRAGERGVSPFELLEMLSGDGA